MSPRFATASADPRPEPPSGRLVLLEAPAGGPAAPAAWQDRFAAYVAHELRTPIACQRALVEVTLADPLADAAALREMGDRVIAGCDRQQALIEALLDLARSRCGLGRREPVDLGAVAAKALRAHDLSEFDSVVVLEPAWTTGDPELVERLAANLVFNAIRHNVPCGGRIEVTTGAVLGRAVLSVANTGPSIPAAELTRLFQPFQRLDASDEGLGLGLAIVQEIADRHRAFLTARARAGGGLEVRVSFPGSRHEHPAPGRKR
jgi:signal transduction histidine kinase